MPILRRSLVALTLPMLALLTVSASAQTCPPADSTTSGIVRLRYDHISGRLTPLAKRDSAAVSSVKDFTVRLRKTGPVLLCIVHTNTAFYHVTLDTAQIAVSSTGNPARPEDASSFLNAIHGPFSALMGGLTRGPAALTMLPPVPPGRPDFPPQLAQADASAVAMEREIAAVQALSSGTGSIRSVRDAARTALRKMQDSTPESAAREFRASLKREFPNGDSVHIIDQDCQRTDGKALTLSKRVDAHLHTLSLASDSLSRQIAQLDAIPDDFKYFRDTLVWFRAKADSFIAATSQLEDSAATTERLVTYISGACSYTASPRRTVSSAAAQRFVVQITPWPEPDITRLVADTVKPMTITVLPPHPLITPSYGLSLLVSPNARFPAFSTRNDTAVGAKAMPLQVYQPSTTDDRYSWGATVGLSWRFLDRSDTTKVHIWLPEITVEQLTGTTGFALGSAISWHAIKLGAGALWIQHPVLQGHVLGDHIPNAGYLQVANTYGSPSLYFSLSIFGVPGFASGK